MLRPGNMRGRSCCYKGEGTATHYFESILGRHATDLKLCREFEGIRSSLTGMPLHIYNNWTDGIKSFLKFLGETTTLRSPRTHQEQAICPSESIQSKALIILPFLLRAALKYPFNPILNGRTERRVQSVTQAMHKRRRHSLILKKLILMLQSSYLPSKEMKIPEILLQSVSSFFVFLTSLLIPVIIHMRVQQVQAMLLMPLLLCLSILGLGKFI